MYDKILKLAEKFEQKMSKAQLEFGDPLAPKVSAQSGDIQKILVEAGLWGGSGQGDFDVNSKVADIIFKILDKLPESVKISAKLIVDTKFNVKIMVQATNPKYSQQIQIALQKVLGTKMSAALKKQTKVAPPAEIVTVPWLENVGY